MPKSLTCDHLVVAGVILEQVSARDESGALCPRGGRTTPTGQVDMNGPPTTLSEAGCDRVMFAQGSLVRDTTYMVNGAPIGSRDIFQVRQIA